MTEFQNKILNLLDAFKDQPYMQATLICLGSVIIAYLFTALIKSVCVKITHKTKLQIDDEIIAILHTPVLYTVLIIGFSFSLRVLPISENIQNYTFLILKSINLLLWTVFFIRFSKVLLRASVRNHHRVKLVHQQSLPLFENLFFILILGIAIYIGFQVWQIDMTAWLASAGVLGIAIGFASKDTLSNFIAGIFILADSPYKIGDYVVLDTGERGEIKEIGIRSTRMLTRDDVELTIPNAIMGNTKIVNQSGGPHKKFRIRIPVSVAYGTDIEATKQLLLNICSQFDKVCESPEARVRFRQLGPSGLNLELLCWVEEPSLRGSVTDHLLTEIHDCFLREKIEIPFPKLDVYIKEFQHNS